MASMAWDMERTKTLIFFYESHEFLWNENLDSYKNKFLRTKALQDLVIILAAENFTCTEKDISKKWNSLKTNYNHHKSLIEAKKSGSGADSAHKPTVWWWEYLQFLHGKTGADESYSNIEFLDEDNEEKTKESEEPKTKKKKGKKEDEASAAEAALINCAAAIKDMAERAADEVDSFVQFVGSELRQCKEKSPVKFKKAKKAIIKILLEIDDSD